MQDADKLYLLPVITLYTNHPDKIEIPPCWKELMTLNFYKSETYKTLQEKEKGL